MAFKLNQSRQLVYRIDSIENWVPGGFSLFGFDLFIFIPFFCINYTVNNGLFNSAEAFTDLLCSSNRFIIRVLFNCILNVFFCFVLFVYSFKKNKRRLAAMESWDRRNDRTPAECAAAAIPPVR